MEKYVSPSAGDGRRNLTFFCCQRRFSRLRPNTFAVMRGPNQAGETGRGADALVAHVAQAIDGDARRAWAGRDRGLPGGRAARRALRGALVEAVSSAESAPDQTTGAPPTHTEPHNPRTCRAVRLMLRRVAPFLRSTGWISTLSTRSLLPK